jgi:hypothetical protein
MRAIPKRIEAALKCGEIDLACFDLVVFAVRNPTAKLELNARLHARSGGPPEPLTLRWAPAPRARSREGSARRLQPDVLELVDFPIKSHGYSRVVPHPLGSQLRSPSLEDLGLFSFSSFGTRGLYGTLESVRI